jgi:hypothetical protein
MADDLRQARRVARWRRCALACSILACSGLLEAGAAGPQPAADDWQWRAGAPATVLSTADMERLGIAIPDGTIGFVREPGARDYYVAAAAGSFSGVGLRARRPAGTYAFFGALEGFEPVRREEGWPALSLADGRAQPSPDHSEFDRDYGGGGPTYLLHPDGSVAPLPAGQGRGPVSRDPGAVLVQIYHGEYHFRPKGGLPAYGGSGMAVSYDGGRSFVKLGQILAPHVTREEVAASSFGGGLWADGAMVEADGQRRWHAEDLGREASRRSDRYFYLVFTDHNSLAEPYVGISIARAPVHELYDALRQHRAPRFRKYFDPQGQGASGADRFTEPGLGGRSTPVLATRGQFINTPGVLFDRRLQRYLLFYQSNQKEVQLRTSEDLIRWSEPFTAFSAGQDSDLRVFYPSVAGEDDDPQLPGERFFLYFLVRERDAAGRFAHPRLLREEISAAR